MRHAALLCAFLLAASTARADADVPTIRLGEAPPTPTAADPTTVQAVERFLVARQEASVSRIKSSDLRRRMAGSRQFDDEILAGPRGAILLAFDFEDADLPARAARVSRFRIPVYLLFTKEDGEVVESRTEQLTFVAAGGGWACADIVPTDVVSWDVSGTIDEANAAGIGAQLDVLRQHLQSSSRHDSLVGYSLADVERGGDGRVIVHCIRYSAARGRRGFEVEDEPVVLVKHDGSYRIDSN